MLTYRPPEPGDLSAWNTRIEPLREFHTSSEEDLYDFLDAAALIGLGARVSNYRDDDGIGWEIEMRTHRGLAPLRGLRTWALPAVVPIASTWTGRQSDGNPTEDALVIARRATTEGHWVRLHLIELDDDQMIGNPDC